MTDALKPTREQINEMRLKAFRTNSHDDRMTYYKACSGWFQDEDYRELERASAAAPSWQPIETAPKNGKRILAYTHDDQIREVWWQRDYIDGAEYWQDDYDGELQPTHWMPLPAPPET